MEKQAYNFDLTRAVVGRGSEKKDKKKLNKNLRWFPTIWRKQ